MSLFIRYLVVIAVLCGVYLLPHLFIGEFKTELHILLLIKLPICITAIIVGSCIASGSAALQTTLNNPLADPGIIGISSGASLVAAIFLVFVSASSASESENISSLFAHLQNYSLYYLPLMCFIGAALSGLLIYQLSKKTGGAIASVILAGIAISTLFSAVVGWIYLVAPPQSLQSLTFWLMGSLSYTNFTSLIIVLPIAGIALYLLMNKSSMLNLLYLGEQAAMSAGVNAKKIQSQIFILVAVLIGMSVSIAGSIAFLGLLVPHFVRQLHGYDNKQVIVYSAMLGSIVMLLCAIINEYFSNTAIPISMLTASIGAPLFIYIMLSRQHTR